MGDTPCTTRTHAVANQQYPKAVKITFRVSCYPARNLAERIQKHRLQLGLKQVELVILMSVKEMTN